MISVGNMNEDFASAYGYWQLISAPCSARYVRARDENYLTM